MDSISSSSDPPSEYLVDMKAEFENPVLKTSDYVISIRSHSETNVLLEDGTTAPKNLREIENFGIPIYKTTLLDGSLLYIGKKDGEQIAITVPRNNLKSSDLATLASLLDTAKSCTLLTGAEKSDSAHTAASQTILTATQPSDSAHTAFSQTILTGAEASNSAHTALSCDMLTADLLSTSALTAFSRTLLTAAEVSDMVKTAVSETMLTAADKSDSVHTAKGCSLTDLQTAISELLLTATDGCASTHTASDYPLTMSSASCETANNGLEEAVLHTAWELENLITQENDSLYENSENSVEP